MENRISSRFFDIFKTMTSHWSIESLLWIFMRMHAGVGVVGTGVCSTIRKVDLELHFLKLCLCSNCPN